MTMINSKNLHQTFQAEKTRMAQRNISYRDSSPPLVSIIGPTGSGKTTFLNSVMLHYWKTVRSCVGLTLIKARNRKYAFYECKNDIERIIDAIKVSDVIVFVVDLSAGLQKDTFEAINMMNSHGVPRFCFALTNCDRAVSTKTLSKIEDRLQREFSFSVKFFHMRKTAETESAHPGCYEDVEGFVRHLETMRYRAVEWKCLHPYIIVDRIHNGMGYGYVRGGPIDMKLEAHVPGFGDVDIQDIKVCKDPLDSKGDVFHNPGSADFEYSESSSAETVVLEEDNVQLFEENEPNAVPMNTVETENIPEEIKDDAVEQAERNEDDLKKPEETNSTVQQPEEANEDLVDYSSTYTVSCKRIKLDHSIEEENDLGVLRVSLKRRFQPNGDTTEEATERFNEKYRNRESEERAEGSEKLILPGSYVKFELEVDHDPSAGLLIVGSFLAVENINLLLKCRFIKNRWQETDIKSNTPQFFSVGWCRFQSVPIFSRNDLFLNRCGDSSTVLFFGPTVPFGTSFFMYSYDADYRIFGSGRVSDMTGVGAIRKKVKLTGRPRSIAGQTAVVQSMFSTRREVEKFLHARLSTASGIRGLIKSPVGEDGCFRATFEGAILMSEIVFLKCFVPVDSHIYIRHTSDNAKYIKSLKEIKPEYLEPSSDGSEPSSSTSSDDGPIEEIQSEGGYRYHDKSLPFKNRTIVEITDDLELPDPPERLGALEDLSEMEERLRDSDARSRAELEKKREERHRRNKEEEAARNDARRRNSIQAYLKRKSRRQQ